MKNTQESTNVSAKKAVNDLLASNVPNSQDPLESLEVTLPVVTEHLLSPAVVTAGKIDPSLLHGRLGPLGRR